MAGAALAVSKIYRPSSYWQIPFTTAEPPLCFLAAAMSAGGTFVLETSKAPSLPPLSTSAKYARFDLAAFNPSTSPLLNSVCAAIVVILQ